MQISEFEKFVTLTVVSVVLIGVLVVAFVDWRAEEKKAPRKARKLPAPIRYLGHLALKIADGAFLGI